MDLAFSEGEAANKQYRDSVFCHYFRDKVRLLSLCNALLDSDYQNPDDMTITTLKGTFFNYQKNDISCEIGGKSLVLVEHQTIASENLPFRCLSYVAELLNNLVKDKRSLYKKKRIYFPNPEFFVLYNGEENTPLKQEMRLSDAFVGENHSLELIVTLYNINYGLKPPLLTKCDYLKDYSVYVSKVKEGVAKGLTLEKAITEAVHYCIEHNVMKKYLEEHAGEVFTMTRLEWNIDDAKIAWKEEGREEGREEGIASTAVNMLKENIPIEIIARVTNLPANEILSLR